MELMKAKYEKLIQQSGDDQTKISALTKKRDKDLKRLQDFKLQKIDPARICTNFDGNPKGDYRKKSEAE